MIQRTQSTRSKDCPACDGQLPFTQLVILLSFSKPAGCLDPQLKRDILVIGTSHTLQAYDVHTNMDLFNKAAPDGVACLRVGECGSSSQPLLYVGSSVSVMGLDASGTEAYWTVSNGPVAALSFADFDMDGKLELLTGAQTCDIQVVKQV
jgi:Ciliary BBSome complex subunit 2, N-terminal